MLRDSESPGDGDETARPRKSKAWALGSGCSMYSEEDAGFGARQTSEYQLPSSLAF